MDAEESPQTDGRAVLVWLWSIYAMVFLMVLIGGITRLTGSGLSMVEWHPLMGALPPLSDTAWNDAFEKYKQFPQYQLVNSWMDLEAFKKIFFWEYLHRVFGRLIGVAVFVPWLLLLIRKRLSRRTKFGALIAIGLGGAQGLLGWYMVKSGLVDVPAVSHFRLAAHLLLALVVSQWILWMILNIAAPWKRERAAPSGSRPMAAGLLALLYVQIAYGAFVAGKRAGFLSSTFPDMNGHFLPGSFFTEDAVMGQLVNNPLVIHYVHRFFATVLFIAVVAAGVWLIKKGTSSWDVRLGRLLILMVLAQFLLGVFTVVLMVPIPWAAAHQGGAVILLGLITALLHRSLGADKHAQVGDFRSI